MKEYYKIKPFSSGTKSISGYAIDILSRDCILDFDDDFLITKSLLEVLSKDKINVLVSKANVVYSVEHDINFSKKRKPPSFYKLDLRVGFNNEDDAFIDEETGLLVISSNFLNSIKKNDLVFKRAKVQKVSYQDEINKIENDKCALNPVFKQDKDNSALKSAFYAIAIACAIMYMIFK
ncbi:hypothetical protein [Acinetobacter courvalinii]|uniref:hypothetical protein n=1 Tax=Acinetobacter courvalinii TaxID=280147 RepID=UPI00289A1BD1|nr:hypothetical protein [Acinetobacter courvalinii]